MSMRRIAVLSVHSSPLATLGGKKAGGMNVYVREMAREMGQRGIAVDVFTRRVAQDQPEVDRSIGDNVRVVNIPAGGLGYLDPNEIYNHVQEFAAGVLAFATKQVNFQPYDFIYSHYWVSGWVANKLKEVWGTPFAQMFHTLGHMKNRISPNYRGIRLPDVRVTAETRIVQWADCLIAATPAEQTQLLWLYRADARKIAIIPPGVNTTRFYPRSQQAARDELSIAQSARMLLFVGRIERLKAVDSVIEALHLVNQQQPDVLEDARFMVVGGEAGNPELKHMQDLVHEYELEHVVQFVGAKSHHLLPTYFAAATAVILPSDYESFGMVALEAMAVGTPVIASKVGGLAFLVRDGETGYHIPTREPQGMADRIVTLFRDPALGEDLGKNAALVAQQYSWVNIVDRLLQAFDETRKRPRRSARP